MDYVRMRALAEELGAFAERLEGGWRIEIGPAGPVLSLRRRPKRHAGTLRRLRTQLDEQVRATHPGRVWAAPHIEHPALARMRQPDAALVPEAALGEAGPAVDAARVLAVTDVVTPATPPGDRAERLADYPAMGIAHYLIVDPRTGTIEVHSDPCKGRYARKDAYIFGDAVPFGPWLVESADFRRYGRTGS